MPLKSYYVDLHVHLGRSEDGSPIKITASSQLTFANCIKEAVDRKGLDILGVVDCSSRKILKDIHDLMKKGQLIELEDGGLRHRDKVTILLGAEVETSEDEGRKIAHHLVYFPFLKQMEEFSKTMGKYISNMDLSTQRARLTSRELLTIARSLGGVFMIAHAFTPHKSVYGNCAKRISDLFGSRSDEISALELGLSSDSYLADRIDELKPITFISNSDAVNAVMAAVISCLICAKPALISCFKFVSSSLTFCISRGSCTTICFNNPTSLSIFPTLTSKLSFLNAISFTSSFYQVLRLKSTSP